jgi:hypothetical protein
MSRGWSAVHGLLAATAWTDASAERRPAAKSREPAWEAARGLAADPLQSAFEEDLEVWLAWIDAVPVEKHCMRRLVGTYGIGWVGLTGTTLAIPWLGGPAAVATAALLFATVLLAFELTFAPAELTHKMRGSGALSANAEQGWQVLGPDERARLIRIMNLSRCATRPAVRQLLRDELREAMSQQPLATWAALGRLEQALTSSTFP